MRDILTSSINVPTAKAVLETPIAENGKWEGLNRVINLAKRMGIKSPMEPFPAISLGTSGMTVLELTSAYGVFCKRWCPCGTDIHSVRRRHRREHYLFL